MADDFALLIGYTVMVSAGLAALGWILYSAAGAINRGVHAMLDAHGGWETFKRYRTWYLENKRN